MGTIRHIARIALILLCIIILAALSVLLASKGKKIFEERLEHYAESKEIP